MTRWRAIELDGHERLTDAIAPWPQMSLGAMLSSSPRLVLALIASGTGVSLDAPDGSPLIGRWAGHRLQLRGTQEPPDTDATHSGELAERCAEASELLLGVRTHDRQGRVLGGPPAARSTAWRRSAPWYAGELLPQLPLPLRSGDGPMFLVDLDRGEFVSGTGLGLGGGLNRALLGDLGGLGAALCLLTATGSVLEPFLDPSEPSHDLTGRWSGNRIALVGSDADPAELRELGRLPGLEQLGVNDPSEIPAACRDGRLLDLSPPVATTVAHREDLAVFHADGVAVRVPTSWTLGRFAPVPYGPEADPDDVAHVASIALEGLCELPVTDIGVAHALCDRAEAGEPLPAALLERLADFAAVTADADDDQLPPVRLAGSAELPALRTRIVALLELGSRALLRAAVSWCEDLSVFSALIARPGVSDEVRLLAVRAHLEELRRLERRGAPDTAQRHEALEMIDDPFVSLAVRLLQALPADLTTSLEVTMLRSLLTAGPRAVSCALVLAGDWSGELDELIDSAQLLARG
jgi:hypothetical protein